MVLEFLLFPRKSDFCSSAQMMFFETIFVEFLSTDSFLCPRQRDLCQFYSSCCCVSYPSQGCRECKCASWHMFCIHLISWSVIKWTVCYNAVLETWIFCLVSHLYKCHAWAWIDIMLWIRYGNSKAHCQNSEMALCCASGPLFFLALMMVKTPSSTA